MIGSLIGALAGAATKAATTSASKKKKETTNNNYTSPSVYQNLLGGNKTNEHADYINNTYAGGLDSYTKLQNDRYAEALKNNNVDLLNKLNADASRVGYSLNAPKQQALPVMKMPELNLPEYKPFSYKDFNYDKEFSYEDFNYEDFNYDANNDPSYKQYADMYARQGQSASEAALANASAATGGMASSFAAAANAQAQQAYAKKTADMIPVLEGQAYDRYSNDRNFSYQDYLNDRSLEYDKFYNDKNFSYQDYLNDRNLAYTDHQNKYGYDRDNAQASYNADWQNINYTDSRNDLAYDRQYQQAVFDYEKFLNEQNRGDKLAQNEIDNKYRQDAFDWNVSTDERDYKYGAGQDAIRNSISWANHNLSQQSENRQKEQFEYNKTQDELARAAEKEAEGKAYNQYLREKIAQNEANKAAQEEEENIRLWIADASKAKKPSQWLNENVAYMTASEREKVISYMKSIGLLE